MGATEEQIAILSAAHVTHVSYILLIFSAAFLLFLFVCVLIQIYVQATWPSSPPPDQNNSNRRKGSGRRANGEIALPDTPMATNGRARRKGGSLREVDLERAKEVEEFELEGLMSEEEEEGRSSDDAGVGGSSGSSLEVRSEDSGSGRRKELV